jgi:hypothetical protein
LDTTLKRLREPSLEVSGSSSFGMKFANLEVVAGSKNLSK